MAKEYKFKHDTDAPARRRAFRAKVPGLSALAKATEKHYTVEDLSALGFALRDPEDELQQGDELNLDLFLAEKLVLEDVKAKVMRMDEDGLIGLNFMELDEKAEVRLDKLVLEVQKKIISMRKAGKKAP
jgi:c-di-GMP-binding flagellar brake protein YcgR